MSPGFRLLLIGDYPLQDDLIVGGVQAVTSTLAHALADHEAVEHLTVLCFHPEAGARTPRKIHDKLRIVYLRTQPALTVLTRCVLNVWQARRIAASIAPQLVHGQGIGRIGYIATRISGPSVVTVHGLVHVEAQLGDAQGLKAQLRSALINRMVGQVFNRADLVISSSHYDAGSLQGLIRQQHTIIPNPIAPLFFAQQRKPAHAKQIVFAGVLHRRKNLEGLLRAFALVHRHVPDACLQIVGPTHDPEYTCALQRQTELLQLAHSVRFVGHVETSELVAIMGDAQVLVLFSHEETLPTVIAQACALGKPVVSSRVGGVAEMVVEGENGFLVEPGDEAGLAERLISLLEDPVLCRKLGDCGHQLAQQRFAPPAIAQMTIDAYRMIH